MATMTVKAVRQLVEAALDAVATWHKSNLPYELAPSDTASLEHHVFAVGVTRTEWQGPIESSSTRRATTGGRVHTEVRVRWCHRLRAEAAVSDTDAALDAEADLYKACIGAADTDVHLSLVSMTRQVIDGGPGKVLVGEVTLRAVHTLPLS